MPGSVRPIPIDFDEVLHQAGERLPVQPFPIRQALAWWIGAEFVRRHPADMRLTMVSAYGPSLTILRRSGANWERFALLTECPGCHILLSGWSGEQRFNWLEILLATDRREYVVKQLERAKGLPSPDSTPPTVASSVGPRMIASFLGRTMLARSTRWRMEPGAESHYEEGALEVNFELFSKFPEADKDCRRRLAKAKPDSGQRIVERYWFLCRVDKKGESVPEVAIDMEGGNAWNQAGSVNLLGRYKALGRKIDALASEVLPPVN